MLILLRTTKPNATRTFRIVWPEVAMIEAIDGDVILELDEWIHIAATYETIWPH